ncbi:MAG: hypothetical protein JO372_23295 [Solirubrobacterales bacterium]|nr:hypothetical protein [Solirubrobacterales bacterium]
MQGRLRAAMGMCAAHLRRLIEQIGEGHIITIVMREAVAGARQHLSGETPLGRCPACEASSVATQRAIELLLDGLREPRHARLYQEHAGVCVQHFLEASRVAEPSDLKVPAERLHESVSEAINHRLIELLAGSDGDALSRRRWRHELPDDRADGSTLERLGGLLANEACPLCLSVGRIERSYLEWFLERCREHDPAIQREPGELCSDHLNDAAIADEAVAAEAAQGKRRARLSELQRVLDCLSALPPTARRARRARSEELDRALAELCTARYCPACYARSEIEHSQLSLVLASLAIPSVRERYLGSHGLCARHAIKAGEGQAARVIKLHADARLDLLGWELAETARKRALGLPARDGRSRARCLAAGRSASRWARVRRVSCASPAVQFTPALMTTDVTGAPVPASVGEIKN